MAGSSVTVTTSNAVGLGGDKEIIINLSCVSDDTNGTVPDQDLGDTEGYGGLIYYYLDEVITTPGSSPPTTQYRVYIADADGAQLFLSSSDRSLSDKELEAAYSGSTTGNYPRIDGTVTVRVAATGAITQADIGNSKDLEIELRLYRK